MERAAPHQSQTPKETKMRDRVGALDGTLQVDSPPGAGTRVTVAIPLA